MSAARARGTGEGFRPSGAPERDSFRQVSPFPLGLSSAVWKASSLSAAFPFPSKERFPRSSSDAPRSLHFYSVHTSSHCKLNDAGFNTGPRSFTVPETVLVCLNVLLAQKYTPTALANLLNLVVPSSRGKLPDPSISVSACLMAKPILAILTAAKSTFVTAGDGLGSLKAAEVKTSYPNS